MKSSINMALFAILFYLLSNAALFAQNNDYTHIYYYGWFDGLWDRSGGTLGQPTLANNCANFTTQNHYHPGDTSNDIFTSFWPNIDPYDSGSSATIATHRGNIQNAEMKAVIVSYARTGPPDLNRVNLIADNMATGALRIAFAIRDYSGRTALKVSQDFTALLGEVTLNQRYLVLYHTWVDKRENHRPIFYLYNAIGASSNWGDFFLSNKSFRQANNFIVLGMAASATQISSFGFDGQYNYTPAQTKTFSQFYNPKANEAYTGFGPDDPFIFSAGVSPGYNTHRSKADNKCKQRGQNTYVTELTDARLARPHFISVVSFNEWGEGSQIEPSKTNATTAKSGIVSPDMAPFTNFFEYLGYQGTSSNYPNLYLDVTDTQIGAGTWTPRETIDVQ